MHIIFKSATLSRLALEFCQFRFYYSLEKEMDFNKQRNSIRLADDFTSALLNGVFIAYLSLRKKK